MRPFALFLLTIGLVIHSSYCQHNEGTCEPQFLEQCIKMADPLLKEPKHVFPTNTDDIDHVCREVFPQTWSQFIACIKSFTATCLSPSQRSDFNRAVGDSINSVHKLCTNEDYKSNYLKNADCIKDKAMDEPCQPYYEKLVNHIQEGSVSSEDLCCAHDSFKTCVIEETKECPCQDEQGSCGDQTQTASHFAKVIVDNSLGFLLKQCNSIITPLTACNGYIPKRPRFEPSSEAGNHDSTSDGYFPSGGASPPSLPADDESIGISNVVTDPQQPVPVQSTNDPRTPKEVNTENDDDVGFLDNTVASSSSSTSTQRSSGGLEGRLSSARSSLESWLADSEITDFDEFFRQTFRTASAQPSRSKSGPPSNVLPQGSAVVKALVSTLMSIVFYNFF